MTKFRWSHMIPLTTFVVVCCWGAIATGVELLGGWDEAWLSVEAPRGGGAAAGFVWLVLAAVQALVLAVFSLEKLIAAISSLVGFGALAVVAALVTAYLASWSSPERRQTRSPSFHLLGSVASLLALFGLAVALQSGSHEGAMAAGWSSLFVLPVTGAVALVIHLLRKPARRSGRGSP